MKFIIDSGATKSVVKLVDHLESLNISQQLPMVASAAGDVAAQASGLLHANLGDLKHEVLLEALYMPSCPVNVLSVPQLKKHGFSFSFDTECNGVEDNYMLTPCDAHGVRSRINLDVDPMTGLFYTTATIRIEKGQKELVVREEQQLHNMSPFKVLMIVLGDESFDSTYFSETVLTASDMQLLHERMGHIGFDALRRLQGTTRNLKIPGGFSVLKPCIICDTIKVQKSKWPLNSDVKIMASELGDTIHSDMHGPMRVESMELAAGAGKSRYWISFIDDKSRFGWSTSFDGNPTHRSLSAGFWISFEASGENLKFLSVTKTVYTCHMSSKRSSTMKVRAFTTLQSILERATQ